MTILQHAIAQAAAASSSYQIARSLRFNSADSANLSRTFASAGNRKTWTVSGWIKKSALSTGTFFSARNGSTGDSFFAMRFEGADVLNIFDYTGSALNWQLQTTQVFRDFGAFFHIHLAVDTTQATAANRAKLYINGVQVTSFSTASYPSLNYDCYVNNAFAHSFGASNRTTIQEFFNYYLADPRFVDGQALDPTSFGAFDANTGVWSPIAYSGSYGTNGFWLKFDDNSNNTATTLGKDSSGNGNNWTPNNFSVTAGVGNDSLVDSPTNYGTDTGAGGEVRGNYCTWNPLSQSGQTLANGNLQTSNTTNQGRVNGTLAVSSGKWYFEGVVTATTNVYSELGIGQGDIVSQEVGQDALSYGYIFESALRINNNTTSAYGSALAVNDTFMCAFDLDNNKIWFGKNGTWFASGNPVTGANPAYSITAGTYKPIARSYSSTIYTNFGQRPFAYTAPSGFKALCTQNLPTPAIGATSSTLASKNMNVVLYTGNGSTQAVTGLGFAPDLVWVKSRSTAGKSHVWYDRVRGNFSLFSDNTAAEVAGYLASLDSDGFTASVTPNDTANANGTTYVGWAFKGGGTAVTNTSGTISSQVSANPTAGISVVTYNGVGGGGTVGHGLGVAPKLIIVKYRPAVTSWATYWSSLGRNYYVDLNGTAAAQNVAAYWGAAEPTSSVFGIYASGAAGNNFSTGNHVAYCFAEVAGFSKFGSYTGNGSTDGVFVYLGFRPRFIIIKNSGAVDSWQIRDTARDSYNQATAALYPNLSNAEGSDTGIDILSNGFKLRASTGLNALNNNFVFAAFAESPFNYARAR